MDWQNTIVEFSEGVKKLVNPRNWNNQGIYWIVTARNRLVGQDHLKEHTVLFSGPCRGLCAATPPVLFLKVIL